MMSLVVLFVLWYAVFVQGMKNRTAESRLFKDLIFPNNPYERPIYNKSESIKVDFNFFLRRIIRFEEAEQQLLCTGWFTLTWVDQFLKWDRSEYDVDTIMAPDKYVWKPNLVVTNSLQQLTHVGEKPAQMRVLSSGAVSWLPGDVFYLPCEVTLTHYPFDSISCTMEVMVMGFPEREVTLRYSTPDLDTSAIKQSGQWMLLSGEVLSAPLRSYELYIPRYTITFRLKRKPINFIFSFLMPVIILSFLGNFVFLIPSDSGEKLSFAITIPLSYGVYMGFLSNMVPQTSDGISVFVVFLGATLMASGFFVILSIISLRCCKKSEFTPVPRMLARLTLWMEGGKTCGRVNPTNERLKMPKNQAQEINGKAHPVTWNRVSRAMDLFCFWVVFTGLVISIPSLILFTVV